MALRQSDLFARVKALGMCIRKQDGEYRVSYPMTHYEAIGFGTGQGAHNRAEAQAYYTNDRDDAYATAIAMGKNLRPDPLAKSKAYCNKVLFG